LGKGSKNPFLILSKSIGFEVRINAELGGRMNKYLFLIVCIMFSNLSFAEKLNCKKRTIEIDKTTEGEAEDLMQDYLFHLMDAGLRSILVRHCRLILQEWKGQTN
jgi:hypothetical protein